MDAEPNRLDFPDVWLYEPRGGYGYTQRVPCRVVTREPTCARLKIVVPRRDGSTAVRFVRPERVERDARLF